MAAVSSAPTETSSRPRVVSGMRPTGPLHLGHLVGALKNWAALQERYDCFYFVADWHALTSDYADTSGITGYALDNVADWIAGGVDPDLQLAQTRRDAGTGRREAPAPARAGERSAEEDGGRSGSRDRRAPGDHAKTMVGARVRRQPVASVRGVVA